MTSCFDSGFMAGVHPGMAGFLGSKAASVPPLQGGFPYLVNPYRSVLNGRLLFNVYPEMKMDQEIVILFQFFNN